MVERYNYPVEYGATDPRKYVPTTRHLKKIFGWILLVIIIAAVIYIIAFGYSWATSSTGQRTLSDFYSSYQEYLPWAWYQTQLNRAESIGKGGWSAQQNITEAGLLFKGFDAVGPTQIPQDAPIIIKYVTLVKNFEGEITPQFSCYVKNSNIKGKIIPSSPILSSKREGNVRCSIEETKNLSGNVEIAGGITFPFKTTNINIDVYFTTDAVMNKIGNKDFFSYFDLNVRQPIMTTYNGEPVEVAIGVSDSSKQPIVLTEGIYPIIGLTITNKWKGQIKNLTSLRLELPDPIRINEELSRNPTITCPFEEAGNEEGYNTYSVSHAQLEKISLRDESNKESKEQKVTFECWLDADPSIIRGSYEHKKYKAEAEYVYELKELTEIVTVFGEAENA